MMTKMKDQFTSINVELSHLFTRYRIQQLFHQAGVAIIRCQNRWVGVGWLLWHWDMSFF